MSESSSAPTPEELYHGPGTLIKDAASGHLVEHTYNNGAKHVYALNTETGKQKHISHEAVLAAHGYALVKPDQTGDYLLPSHPDYIAKQDEVAESGKPPAEVAAQEKSPVSQPSKSWVARQTAKDEAFLNILGTYIGENRAETRKARQVSPALKASRIIVKDSLVDEKPAEAEEVSQPEATNANDKELQSRMNAFFGGEDTPKKAERYKPRHLAEARYKTHMRRLGRPLLNAWVRIHNWNDDRRKVEDSFEQPIKPQLSQKTSVTEQFHTYDADLKNNQLLTRVSLADYRPQPGHNIPEPLSPVHLNPPVELPDASKYLAAIFPPDVIPEPETGFTAQHKKVA